MGNCWANKRFSTLCKVQRGAACGGEDQNNRNNMVNIVGDHHYCVHCDNLAENKKTKKREIGNHNHFYTCKQCSSIHFRASIKTNNKVCLMNNKDNLLTFAAIRETSQVSKQVEQAEIIRTQADVIAQQKQMSIVQEGFQVVQVEERKKEVLALQEELGQAKQKLCECEQLLEQGQRAGDHTTKKARPFRTRSQSEGRNKGRTSDHSVGSLTLV